ncbi:MAG: methylmalonyl Co-A mutase-associated GTPase MeaB [Thermoanaerobacteraceae bacterium]
MDLEKELLLGDKRAIARAITYAENYPDKAINLIKKLYKKSGNAFVVGITGAPGVGKSTLTDKMVKELVSKGNKVGILAIDPTSPFTGGAILGDRIRMQDLSQNPNVYIRSMGTRGHLGGLSKATNMAVKILDISGMDYIFIETVGVGQSEIEIVKIADTIIMVLAPGMGDDIQAIKAGIMEIGDIFAINKSDRDGADKAVIELRMMLELSEERKWVPPIIKVIAQENKGITELLNAVFKHKIYIKDSGELYKRRLENLKTEFIDIIISKLTKDILDKINKENLQKNLNKIINKELDLYSFTEEIYNEYFLTNKEVYYDK